MFPSSWGQKFLDGGVWANCPSAVAILEATGVLSVALENIELLSVGTTSEPFSIDEQAAGGGFAQYGLSVIDLLQQAQAAGEWAKTKLLLRGREYRIDTVVKPKRFALDDARGVDALVALGIKDGRHHSARVDAQFLRERAAQFVPCRPVQNPDRKQAT
jgi:hypothetical protein